MCIGNLSSDPSAHEEIVKLEGVVALVELLQSEDVMCGRYAAFALSNIASSDDYRYEVVEEGAIPPLVALACTDVVDAQRQALAVSCLIVPELLQ